MSSIIFPEGWFRSHQQIRLSVVRSPASLVCMLNPELPCLQVYWGGIYHVFIEVHCSILCLKLLSSGNLKWVNKEVS